MHIPDGYLSPSTCAVMYGAAAPFWFTALQRVKKNFNAKMVPLISLLSAFAFVVMMFNVPLPGGTTGHAVGMGIISVVIGPWASILAISIALGIQAVFFGDGGITCYGANCFNMAIVGSLVAYAFYRLFSGQASLASPRRIVAAAAAGYIAINVSALCAAIEFGIQPGLFHDANGAPLYAPYPLSISIPVMLLGHLTFAGLAELVLAGSLVAYLQRTDPALLRTTAPGVAETDDIPVAGTIWVRTRGLWVILAIMMLISPLGLLAAGTAWGEWGADDFKDPGMRSQMATASNGLAPPPLPPSGLEKLASVWTAPMPDYAPAFIKSPQLGYICSAVFGTGLILLVGLFIGWIVGRIAKPKAIA